MAQPIPPQTLEGSLIEKAAKATGRSIRQLAANAGMSDTRWRQVIKGWQNGPSGEPIAVHPPALTLARMALIVGLKPDELREANRGDAADLLDRMGDGLDARIAEELAQDPGGTLMRNADGTYSVVQVKRYSTPVPMHMPMPRPKTLHGGTRISAPAAPEGELDEIDLIYASTMSAREKLLRIRQVLELRALADAEDGATREEAPAVEAGADEEVAEEPGSD
jgi:hypothetical protein